MDVNRTRGYEHEATLDTSTPVTATISSIPATMGQPLWKVPGSLSLAQHARVGGHLTGRGPPKRLFSICGVKELRCAADTS